MVGRIFKLAGLIGGGILALGTGAVGTHFAYPTLEKTFFPKRLNEESKLKESLEDVNEQLKHLANSLESQTLTNETQKETISGLDDEIKNLTSQSAEKDKELQEKDEEINGKQKQIDDQKKKHQEQKTRIDQLSEQNSTADRNLNEAKQQRNNVQESLTKIQSKLDLKREDILENEGLKTDPLKVETNSIKFKSFDSDFVTFYAENDKKEIKEFKIKKPDKFLNFEQKAKELQSKGITFSIHDSFKTWDKNIQIITYLSDYFYKSSDKQYQENFVFNGSKQVKTIKITDYFKEAYLEDAFRVLFAISYLSGLPLRRNLQQTYEVDFCEKPDITFDFFADNKWKLVAFDATKPEQKKSEYWSNMFKTPDDFINYWVEKTVKFVRTGTVDLLDFMNPIFFEKYYK